MKIGFIWQCVYPWDVRLERIMKTCAQQGHTVSLVCRGKRGLPQKETISNIKVHRVSLNGSPLPRWSEKIINFPFFSNPTWIYQTFERMRDEKVDLLFVRDLPLSLMAGCLGKMLKRPIILDMAENYPAALMAYRNPLYKPFLVGNGWLPRQYERISLRTLDHILVVTEEQRQRLQALGLDSSKITLVRNTPERSFFGGSPVGDHHQNGVARQTIELLFVGKLDAHRGTDLLIRAMPQLATEFAPLRLTLVGDGKERKRLMDLSTSLGLGDIVEFTGWVEFSRVSYYIRRSSICLVPHLRSEHTDTTLPNKLFDYMSLAKPVIAADCAPLKRVIDETGCGLTFRSGDVEDLKRVIIKLILDPQREDKGLKGRKAVEVKYNWDADERALLEAIRRVGDRVRA